MPLPIVFNRFRASGATCRPVHLAGYAGTVVALLIGLGCVRVVPVTRGHAAASTIAYELGVDTTTLDMSLAGAFRWLNVDGRVPPAAFPPGSDSTLLAGTLELFEARGARDGTDGTFALRFLVQVGPGARPRPTGEDGRFRVVGDSLHFLLDGRSRRPPLQFRMEWGSGGLLKLTDTRGHVWTYTRW
ncbi:hypothetical protein BH23GEM2_BH23GEM2_25070 [soil metagenome]